MKFFDSIVQIPNGIKVVGCKWIFVQKIIGKNEIQMYKAHFVAQGFSQRLGVDYKVIYLPVMDAITLRYLISFTVHEKLEIHLMDVVTTYLYGSLYNVICMKILEVFAMPKSCN